MKRKRKQIMSLAMALTILAGAASEALAGEAVRLKVFSNLTDRRVGQGLVEQMLIDEYMELHPEVAIEVEALDEEAYKTKFRAYCLEGMPDVVSIWGQPSFLDEAVRSGALAPLQEEDYDSYQFLEGSLDGFRVDGILYGLPRNTDVALFFYHADLFASHGWEIPQTYDALLALGDQIRAEGLIPVAMDGEDGWPLAIFLSDLLFGITGGYQELVQTAIGHGDFSDPAFRKAAALLQDAASSGLFQEGYGTSDYGTALNLFTSGRAAMFYMGSWEASMAVDEDIPEEIRSGIRVFAMPDITEGDASDRNVEAWNGGGYAVAADSAVREEAIAFLNFMFQPDKLSRYGWENGVGLSAQDQSIYMDGSESELMKQIACILSDAVRVSGTTINDCGPASFKACLESEIQGVANGSISVEDFYLDIGAACQ